MHIYIEIVVILLLLVICLSLLRLKSESNWLKNVQVVMGLAAFLLAGHLSFVEFVQKKDEKEKLPPVFNVTCKLEKVPGADSCCWLKASVRYENKSDRRINIILSTITITGYNIEQNKEILTKGFTLNAGQNYWYWKDYKYADGVVLYSKKINSESWYDFNQVTEYSFIVKIPPGYEMASLLANAVIANAEVKEIRDFYFVNGISNAGTFTLHVMHLKDSMRPDHPAAEDMISVLDTIGNAADARLIALREKLISELEDDYGACSTHAISEVYLKENSNDKK